LAKDILIPRRLRHLGVLILTISSLTPVALTQQSTPQQPAVVQPGAPGQSTKTLPAATTGAAWRTPTAADVDFMQGMIMHHTQAVAMVHLLETRSHNPEVQELGNRIRISQSDEMGYMKRWLEARHIQPQEPMADMPGMTMSMPMMPGMLTSAQMAALAAASGPKFDHLFLTGMIQHHTGALTMVKQLMDTPGAGQDADLFDFASDVTNTQQAEIDIMRGLLKKEAH
jgi:uncharacterized protein (DUF305 family)